MNTAATLLSLIQDASSAYTLPTVVLEQVLSATTGTTHGRPSGDPLVLAVENLRRTLYAVLQARRRIDAEDARQAAAPMPARTPAPTAGGSKVPRGPDAPRPLPPTRLQPTFQGDLL